MKRIILILCIFALGILIVGCHNNLEDANNQLNEKENKTASNSDSIDNELEFLSDKLEGEITVSCYDSVLYKDFLELAAKSFESKYPGVKINISSLSQMADIKSSENDGETRKVIELTEDTQAQIDYINKINTELMSGNGPDIIAMDIVPIYKYVNNGQLENLQYYMDNDENFKLDEYRKNIFDALKYKGGQYVFPIDYSFNYYEYDSTLLDEEVQSNFQGYKGYTISSLIEIANNSFEKNSDKKMFGITNKPNQEINMFNELMEENYIQYVDLENKKANFTDGKFVELLEKAKEYEEKGYVIKTTSGESKSISDFETNTENRNFYKFKGNMSLVTSYLIRDGIDISIPLFGTEASIEKNDKIAGIQMGENGSVKFSYTQGYGINSASKNKSLAWEFIKFLVSEEMQENLQLLFPSGLTNLPINNDARMKKLEDGIKLSLFMPEEDSLKNATLTDQQNIVEQVIIFIKDYYKEPLSVFLSRISGDNISIVFAASCFYMFLPFYFLLIGQKNLEKGIELSGIK